MTTCQECKGARFIGTNLTMRIKDRERRVYVRCECQDAPPREPVTIEFKMGDSNEPAQVVLPGSGPYPATGTHCAAEGCGRPQARTPKGVVCANGHGGAPSLEDEEDPT